MKASRSLRPVAKLARQKEKAAARHLGETMTQAAQHKKQLEDLIAYRQQYAESFQSVAAAGVSIAKARDYQLFLNRLDDAINLQQQQVMQSERNCEDSKSQWQGAYGNSKMIDQVIETRRTDENKKKQSSEQREVDDRPAQPHLRLI